MIWRSAFAVLLVEILIADSRKSTKKDLGELVFVSVVFRHADRAPIVPYPKDPYGASYWPNGYGQLTERGKRQAYLQGQGLRSRYDGFLPKKYSNKDLKVVSTDVDRTLMSAYCNLAGLYEPEVSEDNWHPQIRWTPIPVHTTADNMDKTLLVSYPCPRYDRLFRTEFGAREAKMRELHKNLPEEISEHTGHVHHTVYELMDVYGTLFLEDLNSFKLPNWTQAYYPEPLRSIAKSGYNLQCSTPELRRLKCGPLLKDIIQHMVDKTKGKLKTKMWMYSGHDNTIINMQMCLGVYRGQLPHFTATMFIELYLKKGKYYVVMFYSNYYRGEDHRVKLPDCGYACPLETFQSILEPVIPVNWDSECQLQ